MQRWYVKIQDIRPIQGSNRRQDSGFHTLDLDSLSVNLDSGFQIPGVSTIGGFFELNSGCQSPGFHIPPAKTSRIQEFAHPDLWDLSVMNVAISRLFFKIKNVNYHASDVSGLFWEQKPLILSSITIQWNSESRRLQLAYLIHICTRHWVGVNWKLYSVPML